MDKNLERFLSYVKIDTQSDANSAATPSAAKELDLSRKLLEELKSMGIDAYLDEYGIVYGKLEGEEGLDRSGSTPTSTPLPSSPEKMSSRR